MISSDQLPPGQDWLVRRVVDLERQVRELQAGRRLEAATIGAGGVRVKRGGEVVIEDLDGRAIIMLGRVPFPNGTSKRGLVAFRTAAEGGGVAMSLYDGIWAVWDRQGNIVLSTDEGSGEGLARPWLPVTWSGSDYTQWPGTTDAGFQLLLATFVPRQQPRIFVRIRHTTDVSGTTGELRMMIDGVQFGSTFNVGFVIANADIGPIALPEGNFGAILDMTIEGRRTAGTGAIRASVTASWTQQS